MKASRLLIAGAVAALLPLAGAVAQSPTPAQGEQPSQPSQGSQQGTTFESLDKDSDGRISKSEAAANKNVSEQFSSYDKNGNGFIEKNEVNSSNNSQSENPSKQ
jgi:Ca2+-binding EF-hand superfamily protein